MSAKERLQLTPREREVCLLVADLKSAKRIAKELGISVRTVEHHIYAVARQLPGTGQPMKKIIRFFTT